MDEMIQALTIPNTAKTTAGDIVNTRILRPREAAVSAARMVLGEKGRTAAQCPEFAAIGMALIA